MNIGKLKSTFILQEIEERKIPFQNGIPYPSFEPQERLMYSLAGQWKKSRFKADHNWTMELRNKEWVEVTERDSNYVTSLEFDDSSWESRSIPLPENQLTGKAEINGAETYEDGVWYRKNFTIAEDWGDKVITLKCLGVSYIGDFWINGKYIGYHEGGYTPFSFDVSKYINVGENLIVIRIDNPPWTTRIDVVPAVNNDFFNYTGIIQDIYLEAVDSVQIARADIITEDCNGKANITVTLENRTNSVREVTVDFSVYDTNFNNDNWLESPTAKSIIADKVSVTGLNAMNIGLNPYETKVITYDIFIPNPKIWSVRKPNLYVLEAIINQDNIIIDRFYTQFGIRSITTKGTQICLNNEPIFLAGVARHEEWPGFGRTATWNRIKSDFLQIEKLSVNMVRTAHYPNHIYTFIMLDRLGLTSMSEIPLWQFETHHYESQEEREISYQMWREMVFSNFNRPSIIMWSTQNESKDVFLRKRYNENLVKELRGKYNDHRLITQSAAADQPGVDDESMEPLDVAGWTMYFGIFHGSTPYEGTRDFVEKAHVRWPDKPIINTEYGIWSNADNSLLYKQVEIYQDVHEALIEKATVTPEGIINSKGYVAAIDYWTVFDWYVNHNQFYQTMGMYHMDRTTKKPLYQEFVQDHKRLMEKTNGIGKFKTNEFEREIHFNPIYSEDQINISFEKSQDLREFNYLVLKTFDSTSTNEFLVDLVNSNGDIVSYKTFGIKENQQFDVYIPLWKLNQTVISDLCELKITHNKHRKLKVLNVTTVKGGK